MPVTRRTVKIMIPSRRLRLEMALLLHFCNIYGLVLAFLQPYQFISRANRMRLWVDSSHQTLMGTKPFHEKQQLLYDIDQLLKSHDFFSEKYIQGVMQTIDQSHLDDIQFCSLFAHERHLSAVVDCFHNFSIDAITKESSVPSIVTAVNRPFLSSTDVDVIRTTAHSYWTRSQLNVQSSRFTYQRKGNYEAHLVDLIAQNPSILDIMNESLLRKIYPFVRQEFSEKITDLASCQLCVYDALVIRYNSTEAMMDESNGFGAGQPLHRDLGLVSVNIMLNPSTDFEGGGTFFENQLLPIISDASYGVKLPKPLMPVDVGHALFHLSSDRHAGAVTTKGIRDILVIFLTARRDSESKTNEYEEITLPSAPSMERSARLKSSARSYCQGCSSATKSIICRILQYRLAVQYAMTDGEAWHYLGMTLREMFKDMNKSLPDMKISVLEMSISCLGVAKNLIPCDARLYNSFALALETLREYYQFKQLELPQEGERSLHGQIIDFYERALLLHDLSHRAGCDVAVDYDSACLNYGLYLSKLDVFDQSVKVLQRRFSFPTNDELNGIKSHSSEHLLIRQHGKALLAFCSER